MSIQPCLLGQRTRACLNTVDLVTSTPLAGQRRLEQAQILGVHMAQGDAVLGHAGTAQ